MPQPLPALLDEVGCEGSEHEHQALHHLAIGAAATLEDVCVGLDKPPRGPARNIQLCGSGRASAGEVTPPMPALLQRTVVGDLAQLLPLRLGDVQCLPGFGLAAVVLLQGVPNFVEMHHLVRRILHCRAIAGEEGPKQCIPTSSLTYQVDEAPMFGQALCLRVSNDLPAGVLDNDIG
jgi:hypothetical protein